MWQEWATLPRSFRIHNAQCWFRDNPEPKWKPSKCSWVACGCDDSVVIGCDRLYRFRIVRRRMMVHDQAGASLTGEKCPHPLDEYAHSQIGCREKLNVDSGPGQPSEESAQVNSAALQNGE